MLRICLSCQPLKTELQMGIEPQKTFYTTVGSWIDWNPIAVEKTPKTPFGKAEKNAPKGGWPRLLLNEHLGGKRRFQKEEFEKCEPSKPKKWKKSQDLQLRGPATLEFLPFLGLWWAHFSSSWSLPLPSRYSSRSWLWSSTFSTFFARFPKGWGWVFIPQRWGSIWSENHRLYRRFFVVIFRFVVLFCRLTRKTDHSAFEIYLYSPLEVFVRWLAAKIHLVPPPVPPTHLIPKQPLNFILLVCTQGFSIGCLESVKGIGHWASLFLFGQNGFSQTRLVLHLFPLSLLKDYLFLVVAFYRSPLFTRPYSKIGRIVVKYTLKIESLATPSLLIILRE